VPAKSSNPTNCESIFSVINSRKIFPGSLDVHPTENAIVINYTAQASILGEDGNHVAGDKKQGQKMYLINCDVRIRLKQIVASKITSLALEIIDKCKLINSSRQSEVEQLLYYLQKRQSQNPNQGNKIVRNRF
jgi:hypothetical protein